MSLHQRLNALAESGEPVRVGLVGAGKFGSMFLNQVRVTTGVHLVGIADLDVERARRRCVDIGWPTEQLAARDSDDAVRSGSTWLTGSVEELVGSGAVQILIEATGDPASGIRHCRHALRHGLHIIMVNVEADALAGPLLAREAKAAGVVYSLAWGDQPALICEHVDWARTCGFEVVCAGKGTRYLPRFHESTPETVWGAFGISAEDAERGGMNPKMFNSFIDGTKSAIEMTAVCNATGLLPQDEGLRFPPASCWDLASICRPKEAGGLLSRTGTTEVVSSLHRDQTPVENDLQFGTYVVIEGETEYARRCFREYRMLPDDSGQYAALFRPTHMIGLELGLSVASVALRVEPTGAPTGFRSDVAAVAKKDLKAGETLDGEGGYSVWGRQMPAQRSVDDGVLPIGLAHQVSLVSDVPQGGVLRWTDVKIDETSDTVRARREMESTCL